ncbi:murein DD-endopeptidase [Haemophilus parainfluenzae]|uniref:Murein DD-endopeptidase n=1 Tax=Haemophilus parainfluenzae TaxID=729 RepID=A0A377JJL8_HAEPA|nr:murein DD-endopeptidase [Haemophilus parainfluenzae]
MNKSLAKLLSSAVALGSVFFSLQTAASPQDWQRIKRPIPAIDGKANPIGSYSNGCIIGQSHCLIKVRATK